MRIIRGISLKSVFISTIIGFSAFILAFAGYSIIQEGVSLVRVSVVGSSLGILTYFLMLYTYRFPRTSKNLVAFTASMTLFLILSLYGYIVLKGSLIGLALVVVLFMVWLLYTYWYSRLHRGAMSLKEGDILPEFHLPDVNGKVVGMNDFKNTFNIFLFYRGNWCPLCMAQVREISDQYQALENAGAKVWLISPQPSQNSIQLARKMNVNLNFLVDSEFQLARELNIVHRNALPAGLQVQGYSSDLVYPTVIITDPNRKVIFLDETDNYRIRPEPSTFLEVIGKV